MARYVKLLKLPSELPITGLRPMTEADVPVVTSLLNEYLKKFDVYLMFSQEEVRHFLVPRETVITTYVREDPDKGG